MQVFGARKILREFFCAENCLGYLLNFLAPPILIKDKKEL